jgi:small-conductance mechanosensitive channel
VYDLPGLSRPAEASDLITAGSLLAGGLIVGWVLRRFVTARLKHRAALSKWGGNAIVIAGVHHIALVWPVIGGAIAALEALPLTGGLHAVLRKTLLTLLLVSATFVAARASGDLVRLYSLRTDQGMRSSSIFVNLTRFVIAVIALLIALQSFGVSITPILTALGVGGLAVALALQDTLSNFFAGLQIIATKKVKRGDYICLETGQEGYVADIDWRHTSVRQLPNNMVLVPNAKLVNSIVTNYHYPEPEMSVLVDVGVSYGSDLKHVEQVTIDVAREVMARVDGGVPEFDPFVRFHTFNDSSIDFTVILRVNEFTANFLLKHEFVKLLHERYDAEGIVIPFPIRTVVVAPDGRPTDEASPDGERTSRSRRDERLRSE